MSLLYENERRIADLHGIAAGVDEAGRGPLAGPLVTAACILNSEKVIEGLNDSKKLNENKREEIFESIILSAVDYSIVVVPVSDIDRINILAATMKGMKDAVEGLTLTPDIVLIDGNRVPVGMMNAEAVVKGDSMYASIAAASILAKVTRDRIMRDIHHSCPAFNFLRNKGYPTKEHIRALAEHGITEHHRKTYYPVKCVIDKTPGPV